MRSGERTNFWEDIWLGERPLQEGSGGGIREHQAGKKVVDLWEQGMGWKWQEMQQNLTSMQLVLLSSTILQHGAGNMDSMSWLKEGAGAGG